MGIAIRRGVCLKLSKSWQGMENETDGPLHSEWGNRLCAFEPRNANKRSINSSHKPTRLCRTAVLTSEPLRSARARKYANNWRTRVKHA